MRHDWLEQGKAFDVIDVAAIWPRPDGGVQAPVGLVEEALAPAPSPAVPDMPVAVGRMIVAVYAGLILVFAATMARSGQAAFMIAISASYVAFFLGVPRVFLAVEGDRSRRPSLEEFMARGIRTATGHMTGGSALAQMFAVPVLVVAGLGVIGVVSLWMLP